MAATSKDESEDGKSSPTPNPTVDASLKASLVLIDKTTGKALRLIREQAKTES